MAISHLTKDEILSNLALIEKYLGRSTMSFYMLNYYDYFDITRAENEARKMMDFVGLSDYTPIISYKDTSESEIGNENLDDDKTVFIDISTQFRHDDIIILAIMAHEICHKLLYAKGLYYPNNKKKNDVLADLATIYVGFGKLTLNGSYHEYETGSTVFGAGKVKQQVTKHIEMMGCLSTDTLAAAYCYVCSNFNISNIDKYDELNDYIRSILLDKKPLFNSPVNFNQIKDVLRESQESLTTIANSITVIEDILRQIKNDLKKHHSMIYDELISPFCGADEILATQQFAAQNVVNKLRDSPYDGIVINSVLQNVINLFINNNELGFDIESIRSALTVIKCPHCGYSDTNFLKENRTAFVKCPKCKHLFVWDAILHLNEVEYGPKRKNFIQKIFKKRKNDE